MQQAIALNRFGLGAKPNQPAPGDPRTWLQDQLTRFDARPAPIAAVPDYAAVTAETQKIREAQRAARTMSPEAQADARAMNGNLRALMNQHVQARVAAAVASDTPFVERLVHFWANHFAVSTNKADIMVGAGPFEFEAIRPHVLGRFSDMVMAVEYHPVMMSYLDQPVSVGPNSPMGQRFAKRRMGLNENLAREIMELHTLGVRSGYTQADVTEFARALTGHTIVGMGVAADAPGNYGSSYFMAEIHEPGERTVLGKRYPAGQAEQSRAILADLVARPETAKFVATKLARHFVADDPPAPLVARMQQAFLASGGDLPTVYRALIASPEAWASPLSKFKTPWDWTISVWRGAGADPEMMATTQSLLQRLGQPVWQPGSPAGWSDFNASWAGSDELMRRVDAATRMFARNPQPMSPALAQSLLPGTLRPQTSKVIASAPPPQQLALLFVSPEFQRR
ncbi:DUF1800 domain-containing protein [Flavisphingomonas formosensis]|uniref:DUF1800 domain-containing protein n=1 Tax=Flavisphingomonas formosensis TaxID=861534 RepID=UPI0012FC64B9|nr:DUF1800 domain-containing protein [Sphingomonas formosensis]